MCCYNCKFIKYDSCANGYCSCISSIYYRTIVVDDSYSDKFICINYIKERDNTTNE